tara:strand:+ start:15151 stop:16917 length:1767 start_codon:yes stop_codon:yes gene_type:complete
MADEEINLVVSELLPLDESIHWVQLLEGDPTQVQVTELYKATIFGESGTNFDISMDDSAFKLRVRLAGFEVNSSTGGGPSLVETVPKSPMYTYKDPNSRLNGDIGNIGGKNSSMRESWYELLKRANGADILDNPFLDDLDNSANGWGTSIYKPRTEFNSVSKTVFKAAARPASPTRKYGGNHTPDLFMLDPADLFALPYSIVTRVVMLHNKLFGSNIAPITADRVALRIERGTFTAIMDNVQAGLTALNQLIETAYGAEGSAIDDAIEETLEETELAEGVGGFVLEPLTARERRAIMNQSDYQQYFTTTFNKEAIVTIPILQNFYLTTKYFQNISDSFENTNNLILEILLSTIRNNDDYKKEPQTGRTAATQGFNTGGLPDAENFGVQAKDFILKMILMTPVNILKGLAELIDPHVALSKLIKTGSGFAFNQLELALDPAAEGITEAQKAVMEELGASEEELEAFTGPSGNDLLKLILCLIDLSLQEQVPVPGPPWGPYDENGVPLPPDPRPDNFYPRIGEKGIDFTGTIMGMFMIPPSPIGLIYLLLGLIKNNELETTEDVIDVTPTGEECDDNTSEGSDAATNGEE